MSSSLSTRRLFEVRAKLNSLDAELRHWKELTQDEQRGLRRHHSQVMRIATVLEALTGQVRLEMSGAPEDQVLDNVEEWENQILAAHAIWEIFRAKLVLREDELFRNILFACDDLLWACYGPAMAKFGPDRKGPPMVYFTSTWSPFAISRDSSFQNEVRSGSGAMAALTEDRFLQVLRRLPIPLVSLPWYHAFHLPGALTLAHESGHIVESDFALTTDIGATLDAAPLEHPDIWKAWSSEIFADLYGCMIMGPSFAAAMMDLLSVCPTRIQTEVRKSGKYPTRALRIELILHALTHFEHEAAAARLRQDWEATYGGMRTMMELKNDIPRVVSALIAGPYKGIALSGIGPFPRDQDNDILKIGEAAALGFLATLAQYSDPRLLFAGVQWIHENSTNGKSREAYRRIVEQVIKKGATQFRMRGEPVASKSDLDAVMARSLEQDRQTGNELRKLLQEFEDNDKTRGD